MIIWTVFSPIEEKKMHFLDYLFFFSTPNKLVTLHSIILAKIKFSW